jgi:hypothetical protein
MSEFKATINRLSVDQQLNGRWPIAMSKADVLVRPCSHYRDTAPARVAGGRSPTQPINVATLRYLRQSGELLEPFDSGGDRE